MKLCIDIGNTHLYGGCFDGNSITHRFRFNSKQGWSSDQIGIFLKSYLREQEIDHRLLTQVIICSVVPSINYSINSAFIKYFGITPFFLKQGVKTGLIVNKYQGQREVGSDIIAGCVAAIDLYQNQNVIIVDLGTATTISIVNSKKEFLGGVIFPGIQTQAKSLAANTETLPSVDIKTPKKIIGIGTESAIQSGVYFSHLASIRFFAQQIAREAFLEEDYVLIGTGGFSTLFKDKKLFDLIEQDLIFLGLLKIDELNSK